MSTKVEERQALEKNHVAKDILDLPGVLAAASWESVPRTPPVQNPSRRLLRWEQTWGQVGSTFRRLAHRFLSSKEEETSGSPGVSKLGSSLPRMKAWNQQEEDWEMPLGELSPPNWEQPAQLGSGRHECSSPGEKSERLRF